MSKMNLVFKIIKSLKTKAALLLVLVTLAEFAVVYVAGLYHLPKLYEDKLEELNNSGKFLYFDTLGERIDVQGILKEKNNNCKAIYVSYVCNVEINGNVYFLKAVSSDFVFDIKNIIFEEKKTVPQIVSSEDIVGKRKVGEAISVLLLNGNQKMQSDMEVRKVLRKDEIVLNFQVGSNAITSYNLFAPCENDIYINIDEVLESNILAGLNLENEALFPYNGIIVFDRDSSIDEYEAVCRELLQHNLSVQVYDEILSRTRNVSGNIIKSQVSLPVLIMLLSLISSVATIIFSIDSERKNIALFELIGCSRKSALALQTLTFFFILLPGFLLNAAWIFISLTEGVQLFDNVWISWKSLVYLGITALTFWTISVLIAIVLSGGSYIEQKTEEM